MKDNAPIIYQFAFLGDSEVGKTSIFRKMITGNFTGNAISTLGIEKKTISYTDLYVENKGNKYQKNFEVSIFDTAGQEKYRAITRNYIKGSDGVVLVYDITNKQSFEHVETWLDSILEILSDWNYSNYLIILLGNKLDLIGQEEENRRVKTIEAKNLCDKKGILWGGECSAKDFTAEQFSDLFKDLTINIFNKVGEKQIAKQHSKKIGKYKKKSKGCC